ncbi:MAG: FtsX-like permease family protein [Cyclobacteriaceae bacterium]|nr:FtsX-like permease family protein [Cyclobacteriaceae bacterium]
MLSNFFKTALRNILKNKAYSLINFIGLTSGLALALLIITYVRSEMNYDKFQEKSERLYRLSYTVPNGLLLAATPPPIAPVMTEFFPEVETAARMYNRNASISRGEGNNAVSFEEGGIYFADSAIMKMFTFQFISGNPQRALKDPFTVLINEEMAIKYFGKEDPLGETLVFGGRNSFKVAGVVKNFPESSHIRFNMLIPYDNMYDMETHETAERLRTNLATNFVISHSYTYVLLKPGATSEGVDKNMPEFLKKYSPPNRIIGQKFTLMPVLDIHLKSNLQLEPRPTNSMNTIFIFIAIGTLTLLIAAINYINLSTAQSFVRIKEIGIRKILGSGRAQLISQFLSESFLFCLIAVVLSYGVFYMTLPLLNQFTNKQLVFVEAVDVQLIGSSFLLLVLITLLAGGYPAYFVSNFNSISSIKGGGRDSITGNQFLRKSLVVFQLMIACMLLSGSLMLMKQMNFINDLPLGFQKEHIINVPLNSQNLNAIFARADSTFKTRVQTFRDRIESHAGVVKTSISSVTPGLGAVYRGAIPEGFTKEDNLFVANMSVDVDFIDTYGMKMLAGRGFEKDFPSDEKTAFVVNETAVKEFKWLSAENAIGKTIDREGKKGKVIGVVKDFNITTITQSISPVILEIEPNQWNTVSIRFENENVASTMDDIKKEWNLLFSEKSFQFTFLDQQLDQQYSNYQNFGKIIQSFTLIAILISCLGVYGLVLFVVQRKVKEIGVRKVVGASMGGILKLIYSDFIWLLLIGFALAVPVSYFFINQWLDNFIFHTEIDLMTFVISLVLVMLVVMATISYHAIKAAMANPVLSLRSE